MKNKKSTSLLALSTLVVGIALTSVNANSTEVSDSSNSIEIKQDFKKGKNGVMKGLTSDEKDALETMTDDEKQDFFDSKKEERNAKKEAKRLEREAYTNVIDKLLAGEELTQEEEELRDEIIEKRSDRKEKKEEI